MATANDLLNGVNLGAPIQPTSTTNSDGSTITTTPPPGISAPPTMSTGTDTLGLPVVPASPVISLPPTISGPSAPNDPTAPTNILGWFNQGATLAATGNSTNNNNPVAQTGTATATGNAAGGTCSVTNLSGCIPSISLARVGAFLLGLIFVGIGLSMLKTVQQTIDIAGKVGTAVAA